LHACLACFIAEGFLPPSASVAKTPSASVAKKQKHGGKQEAFACLPCLFYRRRLFTAFGERSKNAFGERSKKTKAWPQASRRLAKLKMQASAEMRAFVLLLRFLLI
jgi:hypothetical protein